VRIFKGSLDGSRERAAACKPASLPSRLRLVFLRPTPMPNGVSADLLNESSAQGEHDPITKTLLLALASILATLLGCQDPSKWYLTGYDNEQYIFKHDHKAYAAVCWQSFHPG
jgi:hypothetical protein